MTQPGFELKCRAKFLFMCFSYLLHLTTTLNMSLQEAFLWLVFDDRPALQYLFATWATSNMARPIARWCLMLGKNPLELYWTRGPRTDDLHNKSYTDSQSTKLVMFLNVYLHNISSHVSEKTHRSKFKADIKLPFTCASGLKSPNETFSTSLFMKKQNQR